MTALIAPDSDPGRDPHADLRRRMRPSREQLRVAAAMLSAAPEEVTSVVVPVIVSGSAGRDGRIPNVAANPRLEYPGGYWLADRSVPIGAYGYRAAREAAEAAAEAHLRGCGARGVSGWVSIRTDGTWAALDGPTL
jgi:hypothetical protein